MGIVFESWEDAIVELMEKLMDLQFMEVTDVSKFQPKRNHKTNPLVDSLVSGNPQFIPLKDDKTAEQLNSLYEAAKRRGMKCTLAKGEIDGVIGYLAKFTKDNGAE